MIIIYNFFQAVGYSIKQWSFNEHLSSIYNVFINRFLNKKKLVPENKTNNVCM